MKLRTIAFWLILLTIALGGIVPFAAQFLFPAIFPSYKPFGAEVWNQYVSIILGIVATTLSIISLVLCFRSEDRSQISNTELNNTFEKLNGRIDKIGENQTKFENKVLELFSQDKKFENSNRNIHIEKNTENNIDENKSI